MTEHSYTNKCACNEYRSLRYRHCLEPLPNYIPTTEGGILNTEMYHLRRKLEEFRSKLSFNPVVSPEHEKVIFQSMDEGGDGQNDKHGQRVQSEYVNQEPLTTQTYDSVIQHTRPGIRQRYIRAYTRLKQHRLDITQKMASVKAFIKWEKSPTEKVEEKPGRMIQYRSYEYLYLLKSFILTFCLALKSCSDSIHGQLIRTIYTKLYDNNGVAELLLDSWNSFRHPVAICLDHSKFDGHYHRDLLDLEHSFWANMFRNETLGKLLNMQIDNRGYTQNGIRYRYIGKRSSGEYTTSEGNSLLNYCMLATWLERHGVNKYRIHVNGDDSVVIIDYSNLHLVEDTLEYFNNFNMETTVDIIAHDFRQISFCQTKPIRVLENNSYVWHMIKDPIRTMSRMCYCDTKYVRCKNRYRAGITLCELACSSGVPILQSWCTLNLEWSKLARPLGSVDKIPATVFSKGELKLQTIGALTREDFAVAFEIPPEQQISIEMALAGNTTNYPSLERYINQYKHFHLH